MGRRVPARRRRVRHVAKAGARTGARASATTPRSRRRGAVEVVVGRLRRTRLGEAGPAGPAGATSAGRAGRSWGLGIRSLGSIGPRPGLARFSLAIVLVMSKDSRKQV